MRSGSLKPKVLIVLDDYIMARSLEALLSLNEYETVGIATNATEALMLAENTKPDVAIIDDGTVDYMSCAKVLEQQVGLLAIYLVSSGNQELFSTTSTCLVKPVHSLQLIHTVLTTLCQRRGSGLSG